MSIPVLLVHSNDVFYLDFTVNQIHATNPTNPIYLIGSNIHRRYPFVTYIDIERYSAATSAIESVYRHMSHNDHRYTLFNLARWFVIRDFCLEHRVKDFLCLDSDSMIYCDIDSYCERWKSFAFTVSQGDGPHCMYFSAISWLEKVCQFMIRLYTDKELVGRFEGKWRHHTEHSLPGGVDDMTAFYEFQADHPGCTREISAIENGEVFDHNMNVADGFRMKGDIKDIDFDNHRPYGTLESGQRIKFNLLHFQGKAKVFLPDFYTGPKLSIRTVS